MLIALKFPGEHCYFFYAFSKIIARYVATPYRAALKPEESVTISVCARAGGSIPPFASKALLSLGSGIYGLGLDDDADVVTLDVIFRAGKPLSKSVSGYRETDQGIFDRHQTRSAETSGLDRRELHYPTSPSHDFAPSSHHQSPQSPRNSLRPEEAPRSEDPASFRTPPQSRHSSAPAPGLTRDSAVQRPASSPPPSTHLRIPLAIPSSLCGASLTSKSVSSGSIRSESPLHLPLPLPTSSRSPPQYSASSIDHTPDHRQSRPQRPVSSCRRRQSTASSHENASRYSRSYNPVSSRLHQQQTISGSLKQRAGLHTGSIHSLHTSRRAESTHRLGLGPTNSASRSATPNLEKFRRDVMADQERKLAAIRSEVSELHRNSAEKIEKNVGEKLRVDLEQVIKQKVKEATATMYNEKVVRKLKTAEETMERKMKTKIDTRIDTRVRQGLDRMQTKLKGEIELQVDEHFDREKGVFQNEMLKAQEVWIEEAVKKKVGKIGKTVIEEMNEIEEDMEKKIEEKLKCLGAEIAKNFSVFAAEISEKFSTKNDINQMYEYMKQVEDYTTARIMALADDCERRLEMRSNGMESLLREVIQNGAEHLETRLRTFRDELQHPIFTPVAEDEAEYSSARSGSDGDELGEIAALQKSLDALRRKVERKSLSLD